MSKSRKCTTLVEMLERRVLLNAVAAGPEFRVNTHTTESQSVSSVAMDHAGNFVIVWRSLLQDGSSLGVYAQRYNALGLPQGTEFRVNTYTTNRQWAPKVAMDADGDFIIVWTSDYQDGSSSGVYAQRYNALGAPQGTEFRVNTWTTNAQAYASVAMDSDGNAVIAWASNHQDGSNFGVYAQRYDAAGVPQGTEFRVNTHTTGSQSFPSVATDADGGFVIVWDSDRNARTSVYAQRYNAAGMPLGGEFQVNENTTSFNSRSSIAMNTDGDFVVVWQRSPQLSSEQDHYARRYNAAGVPQGSEFRINTNTPLEFIANDTAIAMDAQGNFIVAWQGVDPDRTVGYVRRFSAEGNPLGSEFQVSTYTTSPQLYPRVAMDADGDFLIAWTQIRQQGSGNDVYAQRYAIQPAVTGSEFRFAAGPQALSFTFDRDVAASLGTEDLTLENLTTGQTTPASDLFLTYDANANVATFTYTGSGGGLAGVLPDGNYRATLLAAGIATPAGASPAENHPFEFFFLNGDANRDGLVNLADFNRLAANFGQSGPTIDFTKGDFNYDGTVNLADFNILAARFGTVLAAPRAGSAVAFSASRIDSDRLDELSR